MNLQKMEASSYLLPDPGGDVVRDCIKEIRRLRKMLEGMPEVTIQFTCRKDFEDWNNWRDNTFINGEIRD